ncbi:MAG TPA: HAMP domain-containing sensor histidine kinase [Burkholderiaceae bacterium]|nr:HAMP domain-containing sensor histidine kinase [Burkholderiaceae bacterium]
MTLQRRISLALGALVALFVVAQGVLAYLSLEEQEDTLVDEIVLLETKRLVARIDSGELETVAGIPEIALGGNFSAWLLAGGEADAPALPLRARTLAAGPHRIYDTDGVFHIVVAPTSRGRLVVQYDATLNEALVDQFGVELLIIGALCIGLGLVLSNILARLVVAPLKRLTERLARWAPGNSAPPASNADEEAALLAAFDRVRLGLEQAATRQREFAANIAHEIRTPLSAVRTDLELTALSPQLTVDEHARLSRAMATIDAAASTLESLRALSSSQPGKLERTDLRELVEDAWGSLVHDGDAPPLSLVNEVPRDEIILTDRHALLTILRNLLRNAAEHAGRSSCVVRRNSTGLTVADNGPGIAPADLPFVFERYFRGRLKDAPGQEASERGLGLAIAKQSADVNGWRLSVESTPESGTCFSLNLSPKAST